MSKITSIRSLQDLNQANDRLDQLLNSSQGSPEREEYRSLFKLVAEYQDYHFPIEIPNGIGMIEFHLENSNLCEADLIPLIGSKAKVSAVLSGEEPLTIPMVRALNKHLAVDLESLVGYDVIDEEDGIEWGKFPTKAMKELGWFSTPSKSDKELIEELIELAGGLVRIPRTYCRQNFDARRNALTDLYSLQAWCQKVVGTAVAHPPANRFDKSSLGKEFLTSLASFSKNEDGPRRAIATLAEAGIALVYVEQLPEMYVDCAVMKSKEGFPVIGLTLRDDSIDSFWFGVLHSVAHIWKHLSELHYFFVDDFNIRQCHCNVDWSFENEADKIAYEALELQEELIVSHDDLLVAAETVKHPANSFSVKLADRDPALKPITKKISTKSAREYFR